MITLNYKNFVEALETEFPNFRDWDSYKDAVQDKELVYIYTDHFVDYIDDLFTKDENSREFLRFIEIINKVFTGTDKMLIELITVQVFEKWQEPPRNLNLKLISSLLNEPALKAFTGARNFFKE